MKCPFRVFCCLLGVAVIVAGCVREREKPRPPVNREVVTATTVLATIADDEKPQAVPAPMGHVMPSASFQVIFSESGGGAAYIAEKNSKVYVVHNGRAGKEYATIGDVALSPNGKRIAYGALVGGRWRMVIDGREGSAFTTVASPAFSPDGKHVAYQAMLDEKWFVVIDDTSNAGSKGNYGRFEFNGDSSLIAYVENSGSGVDGRLIVSDLRFRTQTALENAGRLMAVNADRTRIAAVSTENGQQQVVQFSFSNPREVKKGHSYDAIHIIVFGPDGVSLAYGAEKAGKRFLVFNDSEHRIPMGNIVGLPAVRPDLKGVGAIIAKIDPANQHMAIDSPDNARLFQFYAKDGATGQGYLQAADLVYSRDSSMYAHVARRDRGWFVVINGREGPALDRVVTPVFSPDGTKLIYRARQGSKRFVVVAATTGETIKQHPEYEQVFQPVFTADGKSIAYGVKDGSRLIWKVERL